MKQKGYSKADQERFNHVSIAGMQTRATDILHGTFRIEMKVEGYNGGSCASFFWYHVCMPAFPWPFTVLTCAE